MMLKKAIDQLCRPSIFMILIVLSFILSLVPGTKLRAGDAASAGINNPTFTLTSTNGDKVSTKANENETTVLIFGHTKCSYTRSTLNSVASCDWVKRPDIRVIFADTNGNSQSVVESYEQGYQCKDITFCYSESDTNFMAMVKYSQLYGMSGGKYPVIVLIDKNNKVQNLLTGEKTADEILAEINKFENTGEEENPAPPTEPAPGIENYVYGLHTIDNEVVSTKANPGETTVLVFGSTTCGITKATMESISGSDLAGGAGVRVLYADAQGAPLDATKEFAQNYPGNNLTFCHDESSENWGYALSYLKEYNYTGGQFPYIVLIDGNNRIRSVSLGAKTAEEIIEEIKGFTQGGPTEEPTDPPSDNDPVVPPTDNNPVVPPTENPTDPPSDNNPSNPPSDNDPSDSPSDNDPSDPPTDNNPSDPPAEEPAPPVSDVGSVEAKKSGAKYVTLSWEPVADADGYIIYQYNSSKKKWTKKATVKNNASSYKMTGLTSGKNYRFAVRAYTLSEDNEQVVSESYADIYTSTAPATVKFTAKSGKNKATIKWSKVKGATEYTVYYKTKEKGSWKKLKTTKGTSYTKTKLKSGASYYFTVKARKTYKKTTYTSSCSTKKIKIK